MQNDYKFQPSKIADTVSKKLFIERLPEWMQSIEQIQKFSDDIIQQFFNPAEEEVLDGYIGDIGSPAAAGKIFIKERTVERQLHQLVPSYVSRNSDNSVSTVQFYEDLVNYLKSYGTNTDNQNRLFSANYYAWTPPINPNKLQNFGTYFWDSENEFGIEPDYVVMERGSIDGNTWSLQNFWYTVGQKLSNGVTLTDSMTQTKRFISAKAPIIEFNKNIELMNSGTKFRGVVDYFSDSIKPEDIVQRTLSDNIKIDGYILKAGDTILFTSIGNSGENNRIYKVVVEQLEDGTRVYGLMLDPDELNSNRPSGEPLLGDVLLIRSGNVYGNVSVYWNGSRWVRSQEKNGINVFPKFKLFDINGNSLSDKIIYPESTFSGSELFGLKINFNYGLDKNYNAHVELSRYNYYVYDNVLQSQRYNYNRLGVITEIPGLYFYSVRNSDGTSELKTDWVRSKESSKQFVKQVPSMKKISMYKIFNTLHDMEVYNSALPDMDAYVIETDRYYKYLNSGTGYKWTTSPVESVVYDVYEREFELAQKIDTTNASDLIEVYLDGNLSTDYTIKNKNNFAQSIIFNNDVTLNENTVVEIKTFSKNIVPDTSLGVYEIPQNLQYNPYNDNVLEVDQSTYTLHFYDIISSNITSGSVSGNNDYEIRLEEGLVDNSTGHHIIQNEASILPLMLFTANSNLDIFESIITNQNEYFRFKNKFNNTMLDLYNTNQELFNNTSISNIVDIILNRINVGKDSSFPYALDAVGSNETIQNTFIPPTPQFLGILKLYRPEKSTYLYAGRDMVQYNIDHTGAISKSYQAINGLSILDEVVFELESRIYNSVDLKFKDVDYKPLLSSETLNPTMYYSDTEYNSDEYNNLLLRGYINFIANKNISNETHEYDSSDWMTWNFLGCMYSNNNSIASGSWRAVYTKAYGTYRPHTNPWEMLGFSQRPEWFNQEYEPTKVQVGKELEDFIYVYTSTVKNEQGDEVPTGLWDTDSTTGDVSLGRILYGKNAGDHPEYVRFGKAPFILVDTGENSINGIPIQKVQLISPIDLGILTGTPEHAGEPWSYGDMGEMEFTYMNTSLFCFDQALALLRAKPASFINYFLDTKNTNLVKVSNSSEEQLLYMNSRNRINFNSTTVVHNENGNRNLGIQTWISDYLVYQNKNIQNNFGDVLRNSFINVGYRVGGFTKADQLTFQSDSFGVISQENQYIGLVKSIIRSDENLSALKILWNGQGYVVSGYDLVGGNFKILVPNKLGRRTSIKIGNQMVVHYNEYKDTVETVEYGTLYKDIQDLYSFICSYGEYLESRGWIFEEIDGNGNLNNWNALAKSSIEWTQTKLVFGQYISISPSSVIAKFGTSFGNVESVTQFSGGVWSLMDDQNQGLRQNEINTSRIGNVFTVRLNDDVDKRMGLIRIQCSSYEHSVVFDDSTVFGDRIYYPLFGSIFEMIKVYGYRTANWNGRLEANGFIILETGTLPNFEKIVNDFTNYYDTDAIVNNNTIQELSRSLIGFQSRNYISEMITSEPAQVDFYKGFIKEKGTNNAFEKVLRVSKTYKTDNYKALQEWAFKVGTYGNVYGKKNLQFKLLNDELKQEPQLFTYSEGGINPELNDTSYVQYFGQNGEDSRWISRPKFNISFPETTGKRSRIRLPDIGPVTLDEVSYSTKDFSTAYKSRTDFINTTNMMPDSVWMIRDYSNTWNIFDLENTSAKLIKIEPISGDDLADRHCKLILDRNHGLEEGQYFYFVDNSNYMPDLLKQERQYFSAGELDSIIVPLNIAIEILFSSDEPELFKYSERYSNSEKDEYVNTKYSYNSVRSELFARPSLYDSTTNITEIYLNVYDPINGVIPGSVMSNIDFIDTYDPAKYNSDGSDIQSWGSERVGEVWWDTSNAFFLNYTMPILDEEGNIDLLKSLEYKRTNWGKLLPSASIDIYEWVASPVLPFDWQKYCTKQSKLNKDQNNTWVPSGEALTENYSEFQEYDRSTNTYNTVYYFWVKNTIYLPKVLSRTKSGYEIARTIENPLLLNTPWFAPIDSNSFIISGINREVTDDKSILTIEYTLDETEVIKHEQYQLCREGEEYNFNPNIWDSLWNSMRSSEELPNGTVIELKYPETELGSKTGQIWFMDVLEARREFVRSANNIFRTKNIVSNSVLMNEIFNVKTEEVNPNLVPFKVLTFNNELVVVPSEDKFVENDAVLVSSTGSLPEPLNAASVYFVHFDDNGYIRFMDSPSSGGNAVYLTLSSRGEGSLTMIKQSDYIEYLGTSLDMTQYWTSADWYSEGYSENTAYTSEVSLSIADTKNYQENDVIRITDSSGLWTLYVLSTSRGAKMWTAVGREDSTIALNDNLYNGYVQYDSSGKPTNTEINIRKALTLLQGAFGGYQSTLVFDMVKYVHVEQSVVDWVFKTSYIYILGLDQTLQKNYIQNDNLINQIVSYFEEVKPYRTKIRSQIEQKTSDEDEVNGLLNDLDPNGYVYIDQKYIKSQKDIWDYQYAQYNEGTKKWEEIGSLPDDFQTPNRRFQEMNITLVFDNTKCVPDDFSDISELEKISNKYMKQSEDLSNPETAYKIQRFNFETPVVNNEQINLQVLIELNKIYPSVDPMNEINSEIEKLYKTVEDSVEDTDLVTKNINEVCEKVYKSDSSWNEVNDYSTYNTLVNRVGHVSEIGCAFKGITLSDNPNTRLPIGFGSSNSYNFGYSMQSFDEYNKIYNLAKVASNSTNDFEIRKYMAYHYGVYNFINSEYIKSDAIRVLTSIRNTFDKNNTDPYETAKTVIEYESSIDDYAMVMIPRKYVRVRDINTKEIFEVPYDMSIEEYMETVFINNSAVMEILEINLDDIELDEFNPVYNDIQNIKTEIRESGFYDDINSFDNAGLEALYKNVQLIASGEADMTTDPFFIDISTLNPSGMDIGTINLTVSGYGYEQSGESQLLNQGRFQIQGASILNPYNYKEAIVSIPRYNDALVYMDRTDSQRKEIKYFNKIKNILDIQGIVELNSDHDIKVGDTVMVFTADNADSYVQNNDGVFDKILDISIIKDGMRPKVFTITSVQNNICVIDGLLFNRTYNIDSTDNMNVGSELSINVFRVSSFSSPEFKIGVKPLYSNEREYNVSVLDYEYFYDRLLTGGKFNQNSYDVWYTSNETLVNDDGVYIDHGFNMPIYGSGLPSELVRTSCTDSIQIYVYEYVKTTINPVKVGDIWTYTGTLVDNVYINDKPTRLSVILKDSMNSSETILVTPTAIESYTLTNYTFNSPSSNDGDYVISNSEVIELRNSKKILQGRFESCTHYYIPASVYNGTAIVLGNYNQFNIFSSGAETIPSTAFKDGKVIQGSIIESIIK